MTAEAHKNRFLSDGSAYFGPKREEDGGDLITALTALLDEALVKFCKEEYERTRGAAKGDVAIKRIGAGYIGTECDRELAFRYHKQSKEERESVVTPGALQRHAEVGFWTEEKTAEWMQLAGFQLVTHKVLEDGSPKLNPWGKPEQIGYKSAWDPQTGKARLAGEVDGVIVAAPQQVQSFFNPPCIWESKKATAKKFAKFTKGGVKKADPVYYGQVQTGMAFLEMTMTLFSMLNVDSMEYYWELIPFDQQHAQRLYDRAIDVFQSESPYQFKQIGKDITDFRCRFCDYRDACWNGPETKRSDVIEKPSWL